MSTQSRVAAVKRHWNAMRGSYLSGAGITQLGNLNLHIRRLTDSNIGEWVAGDPRYDAMVALRDLYIAHDADMNAINAKAVAWAHYGKAEMVGLVANLDGEVA